MNTDRLNYVNIGLMFLSYGIAFVAPVELLVVVYAVLGPLHYLTEIPWLHKRQYFVNAGTREALVLCVLALLAVVPGFTGICTIIALVFALALLLFKKGWHRLFALVLGLPLAWVCNATPAATVFGLYLTTLVHVFFFTWLFMLSGSLKDRRFSGFAALAIMSMLALSLILWPVPPGTYKSTGLFVDNAVSTFGNLDKEFSSLLGWQFDWNAYVAVTRFVAFAYTYHYLNWFSKTRIIRWHELRPVTLAVIGLVYSGSLTIYAINYKTGNQVLLALSIAHVFLEFPLNWNNARGILRTLRLTSRQPACDTDTIVQS